MGRRYSIFSFLPQNKYTNLLIDPEVYDLLSDPKGETKMKEEKTYFYTVLIKHYLTNDNKAGELYYCRKGANTACCFNNHSCLATWSDFNKDIKRLPTLFLKDKVSNIYCISNYVKPLPTLFLKQYLSARMSSPCLCFSSRTKYAILITRLSSSCLYFT